MSEKEHDDPVYVTDELCHTRHETIYAQIDGLKKAIYLSSAAVGFVVILVEMLLRFTER